MALGWRGQYLRYRDFFLNIMSLYKKRADLRVFLEVILSLSTIIIFLLFALKPTALTIISLLKEIREKQTTVAGLDQKINDLKTASTVFSQNQNLIVGVDSAVGTTAKPDVISKQVAGIAAKDNVSILGISIGQVTLVGTSPVKKSSGDVKPLPGNAKEMPISISAKGDYPSLMLFLKDLENIKIPVKMDVVGITASSTEKGLVIVTTLSGRVPFLGQ
ncbi:MAG TPA: hypothetical protein VFI61_03245 [Patescibacteria group bacterium]|nr:hypothetical protein [Patescibacteria group bacterium]